MSWLFYSIICAIFSGLRDFVAKRNAKNVPSNLIAFSQYTIAVPILGIAAFWEGVPELNQKFYLALFAASTLVSAGALCFFRAIELSDVSLIAPLRALTLPCLLFLAPILISDTIEPVGILGVVILTSGLYFLSYKKGAGFAFEAYRKAAGTKYMLAAVVIFSFCALCEKVGVLNSAPVFFFASEVALASLLLGSILLFRGQIDRRKIGAQLITNIPIGVCFSLMFLAQSFALVTGPVTYVIALKRSGIILTVLLGSLILKEGASRQRLIGATVVVLGAAIISMQ